MTTPTTAPTFASLNPATGAVVGDIRVSSDGDVTAAVRRAAGALPAWHSTGARERAARLGVVADLNTPIPGGSGNFTGFGFSPSLDGGNVAFFGFGSGGQAGNGGGDQVLHGHNLGAVETHRAAHLQENRRAGLGFLALEQFTFRHNQVHT